MKRHAIPLAVLVIVALVAAAGSFRAPATAPDQVAQPEKTTAQPPAGKADGLEAGIKAITAEYEKAFNNADAKAAAALWTEAGEYVGADGEVVTGRVAIEKSLAAHFQAHPKAIAEVRVGSVLGRGTAASEGVVRVKVAGTDRRNALASAWCRGIRAVSPMEIRHRSGCRAPADIWLVFLAVLSATSCS